MGEAADCKLQLKVELLQSLKKERSETFLQFSQRVEAAASILKTTIESVCYPIQHSMGPTLRPSYLHGFHAVTRD